MVPSHNIWMLYYYCHLKVNFKAPTFRLFHFWNFLPTLFGLVSRKTVKPSPGKFYIIKTSMPTHIPMIDNQLSSSY